MWQMDLIKSAQAY